MQQLTTANEANKMSRFTKVMILAMAALLFAAVAGAQGTEERQLKGLDDQVQEVKSDVLNIAAELSLLEEKLLFPSSTEVAIFVSLSAGEKFRLDSIDLALDEKDVAHHLYTFKELEALRKGGVQRLYTGNTTTGEHPLQVTFRGKTAGGSDIEQTAAFTLNKGTRPGIIEIVLSEQAISFKDK